MSRRKTCQDEHCCDVEEEQTICVKYKVRFCVDIRDCEVTAVDCNGR